MKDLCEWLVPIRGGEKLACGAPGESFVTLRGQLGMGRVRVCSIHRAEHNKKAAALRTQSNQSNH